MSFMVNARSSGASTSSGKLGGSSQVRSFDTLIDWDDLLQWQRDNEYIRTGYRQASFSFQRSLNSVLRIHNETINIWTHLLGALFYSLVPLYYYSELRSRYNTATAGDFLALAILFLGISVCFVLSTFFHTFINHSKEIWKLGNELDHLGIVLVIWSSMIPSDYFGSYCSPRLQYFYCCMATTSAIGCGIFTMKPQFRTPAFRLMRSASFAVLGLSAFIPVVHSIIINGWELQNQRMSIAYFIGLGTLNATGTAIYAARIPERWYPKTFDIYGSSHQIMHIFVALGAYSHATGLVKAFDYWDTRKASGEVC